MIYPYQPSGGSSSPGAAEFDPEDYSLIYGDFLETGVLPFTQAAAGADAAVSNWNTIDEFVNHPGIVRHNTGTTNTGYATLKGEYVKVGPGCTFKTCIYLGNLSTALEEFTVNLGYGSNLAGGAHVWGLYFKYDRTVSTNWIIVAESFAASVTSTTTSVAVAAGEWIRFEITLSADRGTATYYINGSSVGTITTNIPTTSEYMSTVNRIIKSAGTSERIMYTDYIYDKQLVTRG